MFGVGKNFILKFLLVTYLIHAVINSGFSEDNIDPEKIMKKSKVLACIALTKARLTQDQLFINDFIDRLNEVLKITDGKNKIISMCLTNCYQKITPDDAFEIISKVHNRLNLDPKTNHNIYLLGLDEEVKAEQSAQVEFARVFEEINSILQEMNLENDKASPENIPKEKKQTNEKKENPKKSEKEEGFSIFGVIWNNVASGFSYLINQSDYVLVISLIAILYVCLFTLRKLFGKKEKNPTNLKTHAKENKKEKIEEKTDYKKNN